MNALTRTEYEALASMTVHAWRGDGGQVLVDDLAEEVPVALEYNGIAHVVMLASPADLEDFALGFSLSEGILASRAELYECDVIVTPDGIRVAMTIASERFMALKGRRRSLAGRTGCGLCGTESLEHAIRFPAPVRSGFRMDPRRLGAAFRQMEALQHLKKKSGATHAAAWLGAEGQLRDIREDVGRHNALDKLLGAMARKAIPFAQGAALISSRASYEMVQKAAALNIGVLAAASAPTAMAVRIAEDAGVTLIGFVRDDAFTVYTHPERLDCE